MSQSGGDSISLFAGRSPVVKIRAPTDCVYSTSERSLSPSIPSCGESTSNAKPPETIFAPADAVSIETPLSFASSSASRTAGDASDSDTPDGMTIRPISISEASSAPSAPA